MSEKSNFEACCEHQEFAELDEDHRKRLQRARSEPMNHWIGSRDPVIIKVENEASGTVHTVIPDAMDCSCPDSTYRDSIDKHIMYLLLQDDEAGQMMRDALKAHQQDLKDEYEELMDKQRSVKNEMRTVRELIDVSVSERSDTGRDGQVAELTEDTIQS